MDIDAIKEHIQAAEGRRSSVYTDSRGHPTIGVGFNLDRSDAQAKIAALGLNYDQVRSGQQSLSNAQIDSLFNDDVNNAVSDARNLVSNFDDIPHDKQTVVTDMVFNMGAAKFAGFKDTIAAIEDEDWQAASAGMEDSNWYDQVGDRAKNDVSIMNGGPDEGS